MLFYQLDMFPHIGQCNIKVLYGDFYIKKEQDLE